MLIISVFRHVRAVKFLLLAIALLLDVSYCNTHKGFGQQRHHKNTIQIFHSGVSVVKEHTELSYQTIRHLVTYIRLTRCWKKAKFPSSSFIHSMSDPYEIMVSIDSYGTILLFELSLDKVLTTLATGNTNILLREFFLCKFLVARDGRFCSLSFA